MSAGSQATLLEFESDDEGLECRRETNRDLKGPLLRGHSWCPAGCGASFHRSSLSHHLQEGCRGIQLEGLE